MPNKVYIVVLFLLASLTQGCDKNFDSINTDPTRASEQNFNPNFLLTTAELGYGNVTEYQLYEMSCLTQHFASTLDYYGGGDKYSLQLTGYNTRFYTDGLFYAGELTELQQLATEQDAETNHNLIQISRIMRVMIMQRVTDIYGDIPYSEAGQAKKGILYPKFDKQSAIYKDMLETLVDAISKLDDAKPKPTGDLIYAGDTDKWKKLGYSLMLRICMRLVKADEATSKKYAEMAAGNTISSIADNAIIKLDGGPNDLSVNKTANAIRLADFREIRWSKTFVDYLKNTNDPRLYVLAEKADTGLAYGSDLKYTAFLYGKKNPAPQGYVAEVPVGMPNGYDFSGANGIVQSPGYPGGTGTGDNENLLGNYARPRMSVFSRLDLPVVLVSYAQTELLVAEAKQRGWSVGNATAADHFANGVEAAIRGLTVWDNALSVPEDSITTFLSAYKLNTTDNETALRMINEQYWVASVFDFTEAWSNWRRSSYPDLTPVNYPGNITNGTIPRRLPYPASENANNPANFAEALTRLGGSDLPTVRVWWDK